MKRKIALFVSALLLCGCADGALSGAPDEPTSDIPDIIHSAEVTAEPPEEGLQTAPAPIETAEIEEPETEFDDTDWIAPRLSPQKITFTLSGAVSAAKIKEFAGYENIDFDVTTLDYYETAAEQIENRLTGEELEAVRERNYIVMQGLPEFVFVGTEEADWIAVVRYALGAGPGSFMSRLFMIKDGEAVKELKPVAEDIWAVDYSGGELYLSYKNGLLSYDIETGASEQAVECHGMDIHKVIAYMDGEYIVCGESGDRKILVRKTGEVIKPDIFWGQSDTDFRVSDGRIEYRDAKDNKTKAYDLTTRTVSEDDTLIFGELCEADNGRRRVDMESKRLSPSSNAFRIFPAVRVTELSDGSARTYDLRALYDDFEYNPNRMFLDGDMLWLNFEGFTGALDLSTGTAAELDGDYADMVKLPLSEGRLTAVEIKGEDRIYYAAEVRYPFEND